MLVQRLNSFVRSSSMFTEFNTALLVCFDALFYLLSTCHIVYPGSNVSSSCLMICWSCRKAQSISKQGKSEHQRLSHRFTHQINKNTSDVLRLVVGSATQDCHAETCTFS